MLLLPTAPGDEEVRLVGGSGPHEGRVEVYHNDAWGTVCSYDWDLLDAMVVCRELGYGTAVAALVDYGGGSGPVWYNNVICSGSEVHLSQCAGDGLGAHDCFLGLDAGVVCASE